MTITAAPLATPLAGAAVAGARARVDAAIDELTAAVTDSLAGVADPLEMAAWGRRVEARIAAVRLAALAEAEGRQAARKVGALGTAQWLMGQGVAPGVARREVALAGALADADHVGTRDRLASGELSPEQALVITRAKDRLSDEVTAEQRARFETTLLEAARTATPRDLEITARRAATRVDPTGSGDLERIEKAARAQRAFTMTRRDGMYILGGRLDPEGAAHLSAAMNPLAAPRPSSIDGPDPRSHSRRMGDALVDLAKRQLAAGELPDSGGLPTQVIVTMTLDQIQPPDQTDPEAEVGEGSAEVTGGTVREPISPGRARRLACDARILPAVLGGASRVLDLGRTQRTATVAQRLALALRDKTCTAPGCAKPAPWCEAHHLTPWAAGGRTDLNDLTLVCDAHHDLVHHDHWTITRQHGKTIWHAPPQPPPEEPPETPPP